MRRSSFTGLPTNCASVAIAIILPALRANTACRICHHVRHQVLADGKRASDPGQWKRNGASGVWRNGRRSNGHALNGVSRR
jgi:hypothetical protein